MKFHYMRAAGYEHLCYDHQSKTHILRETRSGMIERWQHCGPKDRIGITYKNTHLKFVEILNEGDCTKE